MCGTARGAATCGAIRGADICGAIWGCAAACGTGAAWTAGPPCDLFGCACAAVVANAIETTRNNALLMPGCIMARTPTPPTRVNVRGAVFVPGQGLRLACGATNSMTIHSSSGALGTARRRAEWKSQSMWVISRRPTNRGKTELIPKVRSRIKISVEMFM